MTQSTRTERFEELVGNWQGPVYRLALRMLGDDAAARDVTQEVFVRLLDGLDRYDASREFRPWIYRIARNVVLNRIRADTTRRAHEERAAREREVAHEDETVERRERDALVSSHVRRLPPEERLPVVLHFYEGLSQVEVAEVLDAPRTTVHSRIERALGSLRASLQGAGHLSLVPAVETVMRSSTPPVVPEALSASLLDLAARAGTVALPSTTAALVLGGIIMTKKAIAAAVAIAALSLGAGYLVGNSGTARAPERASRVAENGPGLRAELESLRARNEQLAARIAELEAGRGAGTSGGAKDDARADEPARTVAAGFPSSGIDWSRFAELFAESADMIARMREADAEEVSPQDQQRMMTVYMEYMRVAGMAREKSDQPIFDERILPEFVDAIYGPSLGFDEAQRKALMDAARAALARHAGELESGRALAAETWRARLGVIDGVRAHLEAAVPPEKRERLADVHGTANEMLRGDREVVRLDVGPGTQADDRARTMTERWDDALDLTEAQERVAREAALALVQQARDVLARRNLDRTGIDPESAEFEAADREILERQIEAERALMPHLTGKQIERARLGMPRIFEFRVGSGDITSVTSGGGM